MICWMNFTSPYARKVRMFAIEKGVATRIEWRTIDPWTDTSLCEVNPAQKIPTLETDDGTRLFDSRVITAYLDTLDGPSLVPSDSKGRFEQLRLEALADQFLDAGVLRVLESRRPENLRSSDWDARQRGKQQRLLDALEAEVGTLGDAPSLGTVAIAAALGYADFRFAAEPWRATHPRLAAWHEKFAARPSYQATMPPAA